MEQYLRLFETLSINSKAVECFMGKIKIPYYRAETPPNMYGFPPALIPLWSFSEGPTYYGYWKHWFNDSRKITIVKMYLESGHQVKEIARNFNQLVRLMCLEYICTHDQVDERLIRFAEQVEIDDIKEIDEISLKTGDDPVGLIRLKDFGKDSPVTCFKDTGEYMKDFPHINMEFNENTLSNICGLEVYEELDEKVKSFSYCPKWLLDLNKIEIFNDFLDRNDYRGAWMTLNSNGWKFADAKNAIEKLAKKSNNNNFNLLVEAWTSLPHENYGAY